MDKADGTFRLLSINTWKGEGSYDWRMQMMARDLYALEPDVICLQEAVRTVDFQIDTAGYLADILEMEKIYAPARLKSRDIEKFEFLCHSGLAILSTTPIDRHWLTSMPTSGDDPERMALSGQMYHGNELITVTNLHLTHLPGKDDLRHEQFSAIIAENAVVAESSHWFCCGDYNCHIERTRLATLAEKAGLQIVDCYLAGGGQLPGETLVRTGGAPETSRVDYIFHLLKHGKKSPAFDHGQVVLDTADFEGCYPSDHFGVCVDITFSSRND